MIIHWIPELILMVTALVVQGQPQYEVQVELPITFTYRGGLSPMGVPYENRLANGNCCSPTEGGDSCPTACRTVITVCFREAQHPVNDNHPADCPLGIVTVNTFEPSPGNRTLSATNQAATTTYPGSFQLYYRIVTISHGQDVDSGQQTLTQPIQDRTSALTVTDSSSISGARTTLLLSGGPRVVCREGYFGPNCGCSPRDDSTGHFTCDTNGIKVCLPGYHNPQTNCVEEEGTTTEPLTTNNQADTESTTETAQPTPQTTQRSTTTEAMTTIELMQTSSTTEPPTADYELPIAVGGAVGGLVVVVIIILIIILLALKIKRRKKSEEDATTTINLEELPNSTDGIDALDLYASVNKDAKRPQEPPPINPYQGQIYSEVEKTGLFAKKESDSTSEEPQYGSTQFLAIDNEPQYSTANESTQALNEEHQYDTTFRGVSIATKSNEEPHYSTAITVPSNTATQMQTNEDGYSILKGGPTENVNIGPEYSKLEGTTQVTQHQVEDESQYSELETTKKPDVQIYVAGYSTIEELRYSEIESETKQPQIVYADLEIAGSHSADKATTQTYDTTDLEVQYSHIKNGQSV